MWSYQTLAAIEELSLFIGRLDARISATPLAEAWQVRASFVAAEQLAAVDGTPTRAGDILGLLMEAPLPSHDAYRPANIGLAHWSRCIARVELSEIASRLIGRAPSPTLQMAEDQADWDLGEQMPPRVRGTLRGRTGAPILEDIDAFAKQVSTRALETLRAHQGKGPATMGLAAAMQQAVRIDPDSDYFERVEHLRRDFIVRANEEATAQKAALPFPSTAKEAGDLDRRRIQIDEWKERLLEGVSWDKPRHLGSCYAVIPDRLQELGIAQNRLSCLTGATKRLGFEGRFDDRALLGFLRQMAQEARAGLALLDSLEELMAQIATSNATTFNKGSSVPEVLYAFLLLPAVDTGWLGTSLELQPRYVQKLFKRLADGGLIAHWADAKRSTLDGLATRDLRLWTAAGWEKAYETSMRRVRKRTTGTKPIDPTLILERHRDVDVAKPMALVFKEFDQQLVDIDKAYGAFFDRNWWKSLSPQTAPRSENREVRG